MFKITIKFQITFGVLKTKQNESLKSIELWPFFINASSRVLTVFRQCSDICQWHLELMQGSIIKKFATSRINLLQKYLQFQSFLVTHFLNSEIILGSNVYILMFWTNISSRIVLISNYSYVYVNDNLKSLLKLLNV